MRADSEQDRNSLAEHLYSQVIRQDFSKPGFAYRCFDLDMDSHRLRGLMVTLKQKLSDLSLARRGYRLSYLSMGRFNQRHTTRFHLDGAPPESYLMLGYEPSKIKSELYLADYSRLVYDMKTDPKSFLADFNPMYADHAERLAPYVISLQEFEPSQAGLLMINNSSLPFDPQAGHSLGVMHQAIIHPHEEHQMRVVNSTMLGTEDVDIPSEAEQQAFIQTMPVA